MAGSVCPGGCSGVDTLSRSLSVHAPRVGGWIDWWLQAPRLLRWCVPVAGMAVIWWSSSQPSRPHEPSLLGPLAHNAMHVAAYACIGAASWLAWSRRPASAGQPWRSLGAWGLSAAYGAVDELHQSLVPGRVPSVADVLSDCAGAALAIALMRGAVGVSRRWRTEAVCWSLAAAGSVWSATHFGW